jgi:hypothetical protein
MPVREAAEPVLDLVEMLDQEVAPPRGVAEQGTHLGERLRVDPPSLGGRADARRRLRWEAVVHRSGAARGNRAQIIDGASVSRALDTATLTRVKRAARPALQRGISRD